MSPPKRCAGSLSRVDAVPIQRLRSAPVTYSPGRSAVAPNGPTPSRSYAPGSPERASTAAALAEVRTAGYDIANRIGRDEVRTGRTASVVTPHEHSVQLGQVHYASPSLVMDAIASASQAARWWARLPWAMRAEPFLRAADMLEFGPWRDRLRPSPGRFPAPAGTARPAARPPPSKGSS